jgi:hypothetical protein
LIDMESSLDYITGGTLTSTVDWWSSQVCKKDSDWGWDIGATKPW